jgi:sugar porter (SP) family MFS transporter
MDDNTKTNNNIIKALNRPVNLNKFYWTLVLMATIGGFLYGYDQSDIGSVLIFIPYYAHASPFVVGYIASGALLGAAGGALIAAFITDKLGRKFLLITDIIIYIVGALLSAFTINVIMLMLARTFIGVAIGADSAVATAYIAEFAPRKHRGKLGIMQQYMIVIGIFMSYIVAMLIFLYVPLAAYSIDWRIILSLAIIPAAIALIFRFKIPESPRWLILKKKFARVTKDLKKFGIDADETELNDAYNYLYNITKNKKSETKGVKRAFFISSLMGLFIIANGVNIPLIYGPFIISSLHIFPSVKSNVLSSVYSIGATAILAGVMVAATFLGFWFMDSIGRRKLALIGFAGMALADIIGGALYLANIPIGLLIGLAVYLIFFGIGGGGIAFLIQGEYFPTHVRVKFAALAVFIEWMTSFTVDEIFPYMDSVFHLGYSVILFGFVSVLAFIIFFFTMPETKNLTVEKIVEMFEGNSLFKLPKVKINIDTEFLESSKK